MPAILRNKLGEPSDEHVPMISLPAKSSRGEALARRTANDDVGAALELDLLRQVSDDGVRTDVRPVAPNGRLR